MSDYDLDNDDNRQNVALLALSKRSDDQLRVVSNGNSAELADLLHDYLQQNPRVFLRLLHLVVDDSVISKVFDDLGDPTDAQIIAETKDGVARISRKNN